MCSYIHVSTFLTLRHHSYISIDLLCILTFRPTLCSKRFSQNHNLKCALLNHTNGVSQSTSSNPACDVSFTDSSSLYAPTRDVADYSSHQRKTAVLILLGILTPSMPLFLLLRCMNSYVLGSKFLLVSQRVRIQTCQ